MTEKFTTEYDLIEKIRMPYKDLHLYGIKASFYIKLEKNEEFDLEILKTEVDKKTIIRAIGLKNEIQKIFLIQLTFLNLKDLK